MVGGALASLKAVIEREIAAMTSLGKNCYWLNMKLHLDFHMPACNGNIQ